jgi:hypothetical protein
MTDTLIQHDVVDLLIEQHTQIPNPFLEGEAASVDARHEAFHRLVGLLAVHETAEEQLRPLTRLSVDGGTQIADDRLAEEHDAKQTLTALEEMSPPRSCTP